MGRGKDLKPRKVSRIDPLVRFLEKIDFTEDGCWIWKGRIENGYGAFYLCGKWVYAHIFAYKYIREGLIPDGLQLDHICRHPPCANPWHTEPVTSKENTLRGNRFDDYCPKGHLLYPPNIYYYGPKKTWRSCRICTLAGQKAARLRKKERDVDYQEPGR